MELLEALNACNDVKIYSVEDAEFSTFGRIIKGYDFEQLETYMNLTSQIPEEGNVYVASVEEMESESVAEQIAASFYGGMPIQIGYCNGHNHMLNALEYHRDSEINVAATDAILMLGLEADITADFTYDTSRVEAFLVPKGTGVEVFATTLHYAPCGVDGNGFKVAIVLPKGTNYDLKSKHADGEDGHLTAVNKWLLGHPEGGLPEGSPMGLVGENLSL